MRHMATEISLGNMEPEKPADPQEESSQLPPEPPPLEREPVAFETSSGSVAFEAAPKRRGRPAEPKPESEPTQRGRPPKPRDVEEQVVEPIAPEPALQIDINALLAPLTQAYMAK